MFFQIKMAFEVEDISTAMKTFKEHQPQLGGCG